MKQDANCNKPKQVQSNNINYHKRTHPPSNKAAYSAAHHFASSKLICHYCKQRHAITRCNEFLALTIDERRKQMEKRNLCINCFRGNHESSEYKATSACSICNTMGHHTLLHKDVAVRTTEPMTTNHELPSASSNSCLHHTEPDVLLSTAIILVEDSVGSFHRCRCLLDVGSQLNLLSRAFFEKLNTARLNIKMSIFGVKANHSQTSHMTDVVIHSLHAPYKKNIRCHILERVTANIPINTFYKSKIQIPQDMVLADPQFNVSQPVDMILGAEVF